MIDVIDYMPILSGKAAEYEALGELGAETRTRTRPLIEVTPLTFDQQTEQPTKSLEEHVARDARFMRDCWGALRQLSLLEDAAPPGTVLIDMRNVETARASDGRHAVTLMHELLRGAGIRAVPVTSFDRTNAQQEAVARIAAEHGVCLRLDRNQWADPAQLAGDVLMLLGELALEPAAVDVVIDLGAIGEEDARAAVLMARGALQALPAVHEWRSLVVAGSSFPATVGEAVQRHDTCVVRRAEMEMYDMLLAGIEQLPRLPTFGDYGVEGAAGAAGGVAPVFSGRNISASVRYTGLGGWFLVRGGRLHEDGYDQYHKLASTVVDSAHWRSADFSWGDGYISNCARHEVKPGTPKLWRQVAVNHHITAVTADLATRFES